MSIIFDVFYAIWLSFVVGVIAAGVMVAFFAPLILISYLFGGLF